MSKLFPWDRQLASKYTVWKADPVKGGLISEGILILVRSSIRWTKWLVTNFAIWIFPIFFENFLAIQKRVLRLILNNIPTVHSESSGVKLTRFKIEEGWLELIGRPSVNILHQSDCAWPRCFYLNSSLLEIEQVAGVYTVQ